MLHLLFFCLVSFESKCADSRFNKLTPVTEAVLKHWAAETEEPNTARGWPRIPGEVSFNDKHKV